MRVTTKILIQSTIALVAIALNLIFPEFTTKFRYPLLALIILLIGMPHGALDHVIDGKLGNWNPFSFNKRFYGWYLSIMAGYSLLWIFFPFFSFMFFLLITLYHFGQADAERFNFSGWRKWVIHLTRGITVVGLIVYGDLVYASSVIEAVTDISVQDLSELILSSDLIMWALAGVYPVSFILINLHPESRTDNFSIFFLDALIVPLLFIYADLVWAFSIYFGLWHSYNHVLVMLNFLKTETKNYSFGWFYRQSFVFSLLSYIGLLIVYNSLDAFGSEELLVSLLFVVISILTLPHMLVVEKMYSRINS